MRQLISVLGATGSIGDSTLDVIRQHPEQFGVFALSGFSQLDKLLSLCQEFRPQRVCVPDEHKDDFAQRLHALGLPIDVLSGQAGLCEVAGDDGADKVVGAIVGSAGLSSTLSAIKAGKTLLLANKESLVMAGDLLMATARRTGASILPIDSEHNAIFQCLPERVQADSTLVRDEGFGIKRLWLTASGGGFLHKTYEQMQRASVAQAVKHPNWSMGQKISIDSATMMNKGLELIEACHLFGLGQEQIEVVIHPQSIVHSLVEYIDGSFLAQLGNPDMRTPIAYALSYPHRIDSGVQALDIFAMQQLEFIRPDSQKFVCLELARQAIQTGNGATIALNASNEVAVSAFLAGKIALTDIAVVVEHCLNHADLSADLTRGFDDLTEILAFDKQVRTIACAYLQSGKIS